MDLIDYSSRGWKAIEKHAFCKKHIKQLTSRRSNYRLSFAFGGSADNAPSAAGSMSSQLVAAPPAVADGTMATRMAVPLCDRVTNQQSLVLGVLAEHSLPFTMAPVIIETAKTLVKDSKALNQLSMDRTSASYKMRLGMAQTFHADTVTQLKEGYFSLNIDEATSNNYSRVLAVLVSYFSPKVNKVVVEHFAAVKVITVNSESMYNELVSLFDENGLPWDHLISILMDSCNVMRGSKSGLETRIREKKAPHLLDIDGDSCHHIHNATKHLCKPFDGLVEGLLGDLFTDFKWSADLREILAEICLLLGITYTMPPRFVPHRWLSCYDVTLSNLRMMDAFTVFYYGFIPAVDRVTCQAVPSAIYHKRSLSAEAKEKIRGMQSTLRAKNLTEDGRNRKMRIIEKLFYKRTQAKLTMHFYVAVLPLLKKYVCLFETREPLIHKLHEEQGQLFLDFLSCFIKSEELVQKSIKGLVELDVHSPSLQLPKREMFVGAGTDAVVSGLRMKHKDDDVTEFMTKVGKGYADCAAYMKKKLPLDNLLLRSIAAIDPLQRGHSSTAKKLKRLPTLVMNVLVEEDKEMYTLDVHRYQVDINLPSPYKGGDKKDGAEVLRIDEWWAAVKLMGKYPALCKMALAVLSCFHGPQVESSFSMMGDILDSRSGRMKIETYSATQTVKYSLKAQETTANAMFGRSDAVYDPVNPTLCRNMRGAYKQYKAEQEKKREELVKKKALLKLEASKAVSKAARAKLLTQLAEKKARLAHARRQGKIAEKRKLPTGPHSAKKAKTGTDSRPHSPKKARKTAKRNQPTKKST